MRSTATSRGCSRRSADFAHIAAAAVWFGGLAVARVRPPARDGGGSFASGAAVLGASRWLPCSSSAPQASFAPSRSSEWIDDLWTTSYGRAILVKTRDPRAARRARVAEPRGARSTRSRACDRSMLAELRAPDRDRRSRSACWSTSRPGGSQTRPRPQAPLRHAPSAAPLPPPGAFVDARRAGTLAVGHRCRTESHDRDRPRPRRQWRAGARRPRGRTAGPRSAARAATARRCRARRRCASASRRLSFAVPARPRDATALLRRATRAFVSAKSVVYEERLASGPGTPQVSTFRLVAPNRLAYSIRGGPRAIIDRRRAGGTALPGGDWVASPQTPLRVPTTYWSARSRNAYFVAPDTVAFFDPRLPAWFRLRVDPQDRHSRASCGWSRPRTS